MKGPVSHSSNPEIAGMVYRIARITLTKPVKRILSIFSVGQRT